jgi:hypothetical protein
VKKTHAKGIRIQAKTLKCKNGENLKFMADQRSLQQSSELAKADITTQYEVTTANCSKNWPKYKLKGAAT